MERVRKLCGVPLSRRQLGVLPNSGRLLLGPRYFFLFFNYIFISIEKNDDCTLERMIKKKGSLPWTFCILTGENEHGSRQKTKQERVTSQFFDA